MEIICQATTVIVYDPCFDMPRAVWNPVEPFEWNNNNHLIRHIIFVLIYIYHTSTKAVILPCLL
jgi:hypothetical protein